MADSKPFMEIAAAIFEKRVEPRLKKALDKHGVKAPEELPKGIAAEILKQAVIEAAVTDYPNVNIESLSHVFSSFLMSKKFGEAFPRARSQIDSQTDAFAMAQGGDIAISLAGLGMRVAPFDRKRVEIVGQPTNDIETVARVFAKLKSAFVGYFTCNAPFYVVYTDCVRTLITRIKTHHALSEVRTLFERTNTPLDDPGVSFRHALALFARESHDRISTVALNDPSADAGSIVLLAGWIEAGRANGAPNNGFVPVPIQLARAILTDPEIAQWVWKPVGKRTYVH